MKIHLYSESPDPGPGGAEQFVAVLAEALSLQHEVCIVHHKEHLTSNELEEYSGCDLKQVTFRYIAPARDESRRCTTLWTRLLVARAWRRQLSEGSDVFIALLHNKAPFCRAPLGVMVALFPTYDPDVELIEPPRKAPPKKSKKKKKSKPKPVKKKDPRDIGRAGMFAWRWLHRIYCQWEWKRRMGTYPIKLSISEFTRGWTRTRWRVESDLLHPPVLLPEQTGQQKENLILSVGRFATTGHTKKQLEMLTAFRDLRTSLSSDWRYACVGGLNDMPDDHAYFEHVRSLSETDVINVQANLPRDELRQLYSRASLFWHAAGYGDDSDAHPEMAEHFGLTTVEAMAAGCVPVVIKKGGQPEIVQHGVSGFVWSTLDELKHYTETLVRDEKLRTQMSEKARDRAADFSRHACVARLLQATGLSGSPSSHT